jgi:benzoyl-CoA reductase/2-hydroxyglutaryl-CoA dehydratase subunit BcrC/BadD/HgdB
MLSAVVAGMVMPKEEHGALLEKLLARLASEQPVSQGIKVVLAGSLCDDPAAEVLAMIEELGGMVVDDDLYTGYKYFAADAPEEGDPLVALARRHASGIPCPTRHDTSRAKDPADHLLRMVADSGAQAAIILLVKFCEPHGFDYPYLRQRLEAAGVPHFLIETEHEMSNLGQVRTRLQAFIEMLGGE